jgi:hypothetical protein
MGVGPPSVTVTFILRSAYPVTMRSHPELFGVLFALLGVGCSPESEALEAKAPTDPVSGATVDKAHAVIGEPTT